MNDLPNSEKQTRKEQIREMNKYLSGESYSIYILCQKYQIALSEILCISSGHYIPELMKAQETARKALGL